MAKVTIQKLKEMKQKKERITMVTAYDYPSAVLVEKAGIDIILVNVSTSIDNIVFCVVYISVIAQAIQWVLSTVKPIMSAVGLFCYIESHLKLVVSANQARKKSFICNHAAPP